MTSSLSIVRLNLSYWRVREKHPTPYPYHSHPAYGPRLRLVRWLCLPHNLLSLSSFAWTSSPRLPPEAGSGLSASSVNHRRSFDDDQQRSVSHSVRVPPTLPISTGYDQKSPRKRVKGIASQTENKNTTIGTGENGNKHRKGWRRSRDSRKTGPTLF